LNKVTDAAVHPINKPAAIQSATGMDNYMTHISVTLS